MKRSWIKASKGSVWFLGLVMSSTWVVHEASADILVAPIIEDAEVEDPQMDGVFDTFRDFTPSVEAESQVTNFLEIFRTKRIILEADLSGIPQGATIVSATLSVYCQRAKFGGGGSDFDIYGYAGDGVVELIDGYAGDSVVATFLVDGTGDYDFDLTSFVQSLVDQGEGVMGLNFRAQSEGPDPFGHDDVFEFASTEETSAAWGPPVLTIEFSAPTSVPAAGFGGHLALTIGLLLTMSGALVVNRSRGFRERPH